MKNGLKILLAIAFLAFASSAWAQQIALNYSGGGASLELDMLTNDYGNVTLYQDGNAVFLCDNGGVLYAAPGVTWVQNGTDFVVYDLPDGNYTATLGSPAGPGSYSSGVDYIEWQSSSGPSYVRVDFLY